MLKYNSLTNNFSKDTLLSNLSSKNLLYGIIRNDFDGKLWLFSENNIHYVYTLVTKVTSCDYKDHVLFEKNEVVKDDGTPYRVYTPFSKKWIIKMNEDGVPEYCSENLIENLISNEHKFNSESMGFVKSNIKFLKSDISDQIVNNYESKRNFPSSNGTSKAGVELRLSLIHI